MELEPRDPAPPHQEPGFTDDNPGQAQEKLVRGRPSLSEILVCLMLVIIVVSVAMFLILRPTATSQTAPQRTKVVA
jgi:hypothetical protein